MNTVKTIQAALAAQVAQAKQQPYPRLKPPIVRTTISYGEVDEETYAHVSLVTDDESSGHTEAILTMQGFGSDCIEILEQSSTRLVIKLMYGAEGGAILEGLTQVLAKYGKRT